jgi:hypothetical protein
MPAYAAAGCLIGAIPIKSKDLLPEPDSQQQSFFKLCAKKELLSTI